MEEQKGSGDGRCKPRINFFPPSTFAERRVHSFAYREREKKERKRREEAESAKMTKKYSDTIQAGSSLITTSRLFSREHFAPFPSRTANYTKICLIVFRPGFPERYDRSIESNGSMGQTCATKLNGLMPSAITVYPGSFENPRELFPFD